MPASEAPDGPCPSPAAISEGNEEYDHLSAAPETVEGVLSALTTPWFDAAAVFESMRVTDPERLLPPFFGRFVRMTGKRMPHYESTFFYPASIECMTPSCASDGSGRLKLRLAASRELAIDVGNDGAVCSTDQGGGLAGVVLTWQTLAATVQLQLTGGVHADGTGRLMVALHDLHLDAGGRGEFHSTWTGDCAIELRPVESVTTPSGATFERISGSAAERCVLAPNRYGEADCTAELQALDFSILLRP